jgi:hypothetical protein
MTTFLKKELEENNFNVKEVVEGLLLIEEFISKDEVNSFLSIINNTNEQDWFFLYTEGLKVFCLQKFGRDDVENLVSEGKFEITEGWEDKNLNIDQYEISKIVYERLSSLIKSSNNDFELNNLTFQRMQNGVQLKSHTDQHTDPSIQYAAIIYINDNYNGGNVFFKNKNIKMKPKPGSLLIFPGNEDFEHGVEFVEEGPIRYVIPSFIKLKGFYENEKY